MMTYNDVLGEIQRFSLTEQLRLLKDLKQLVNDAMNDDEDIPSELLEESASAWQDYISGKDPGISSQELKRKLEGNETLFNLSSVLREYLRVYHNQILHHSQ